MRNRNSKIYGGLLMGPKAKGPDLMASLNDKHSYDDCAP